MKNSITESIGVDLGDRYSAYCVVDQDTGAELDQGRVRTTPTAFERFFESRPAARVAIETGTHSPWVSRIAARHCAEAIVANARELRFIYGSKRKSDDVDARTLARVARLDPKLLHPIRHRGERAQADLAVIRARAAAVSARTKLVNALRGLVKSWGGRLGKHATKAIGYRTREEVPEALRVAVSPMLLAIEALGDEIQAYDDLVDEMARTRYPETRLLTKIPRVGNLTALAFLLTIEDPSNFKRSRDVGPFLGLVPERFQSGSTDKQLRITKAGDATVRTLLVQCSQQILGRVGPDCDLKRYGLRIASRGGKIAKRKAVIAVARKLAVLMHALLKSGAPYDPNRINCGA